MKYLLIFILIFNISLGNVFAQSAMSSNTYKIQSDSTNFGGRLGSSASYSMEDTMGEAGSGLTETGNYRDYLGYQFMLFADPDTTAPSAPASMTAQVVSTSEIELTWGESTDNIAVDRYYIYRDGVRIDDVDIFPRTFNDTGLSESTEYSYNVSAVDDSGNESERSATTTATTFASTVSSTGGSSKSGRSVTVSDLNISSNYNNAIISFTTSQLRSVEVSWGRDYSYSDGVVTGVLSNTHSLMLGGLQVDTDYYLKIVLRDQFGNPIIYEGIPFRTLTAPISKNPANVSSFVSVAKESSIDLSWKMPIDSRIVGVKILRSESSYPSTPNDGKLIFESESLSGVENFSDSDVKKGTTYYYTIFAKDLAGNLSSGAVTANKLVTKVGEVFENPLETLLPAGKVDEAIEKLSLKDFLFIQSGDSVSISGSKVPVYGNKNITVALKYYRVPPVLKTIAVSLIKNDGSKDRFTFILRPNKDKTRYEATIGALGDPKNYTLRIDILDFKNQGLKTIDGVLEVEVDKAEPAPKLVFSLNKIVVLVGSIVLLIILGVSVLVRIRRGRATLINTSSPIVN